jgi:hypothetical protein
MLEQALYDPAAHITQANKPEFYFVCREKVHIISV